MTRPSKRKPYELRSIKIQKNFTRYAEGSVLITCGHTKVLCTASLEEKVPPFLKGKGQGWVTAEYGMLPRSTHTRMDRETKKGPSGRTQEISRLIGRALRSSVDMKLLGERQVIIDCDVIQADGGTRCASITGGYVALALALKSLIRKKVIAAETLIQPVVGISCGIFNDVAIADLDYDEDSTAEVDMNFIITGDLNFVEIQGTAEHKPFSFEHMVLMKDLAIGGAKKLLAAQKAILK